MLLNLLLCIRYIPLFNILIPLIFINRYLENKIENLKINIKHPKRSKLLTFKNIL